MPNTFSPTGLVNQFWKDVQTWDSQAWSSFDGLFQNNGVNAFLQDTGLESNQQTSASGDTSRSWGPAPDNGLKPLVGDLGVIFQQPTSGDAGSGGGSGGTVQSPPAGSGAGLVINVIYDSSVNNAPAGFKTGIQAAVQYLESQISTPITVNIDVGYGEIDGQALENGALGESETFLDSFSYSQIKTALSAIDPSAAASLPSSAPGNMWISTAEAKALGLTGANTAIDAYAGFSSSFPFTYDPNNRSVAGDYDFIGTVEHEFTEDMGRIDLFGETIGNTSNSYSLLDLYHYTSQGNHTYTGTTTNYFSADGGKTNLDNFNTNTSGDLGDWASSAGNDSFLAFSPSGQADLVSASDLTEMNALGFTLASQAGIGVAASGTDALQGGSAVSLLSGSPTIVDPNSATLTSATIKITNGSGSAVSGDQLFVNGQQNTTINGVTVSWNSATNTITLSGSASIATYQTLLGEVTYRDTGSDSSTGSHPIRTVTWTVGDGTNNYSTTSQVAVDRAPVANADTATDVAGSTVTTTAATGVLSNDTDADADTLTVTAVSDTAHSGTVGSSLAGTYGHLTLNANGSYSYVADNTAAIASAPTGSHPKDVFSYTTSDGNGGTATAALTVTIDRAPIVTASNVALTAGHSQVSASSLFSASDPDGSAIVTYGFQDSGPADFLLNSAAQANNKEIDVSASQLSQLTYQSTPGTAADTVQVRVYDGTTWSNWTSFTVTPPPLVIATDNNSSGTTELVQVGNAYALYGSGGTVGPTLKYNGAAATVGEFGSGVAPIGAALTASGYEVAWLIPGSPNQYALWATDSNGNFQSSSAALTGTSSQLEQAELTFNQDLNNDGSIGPPPPPPPTVIRTDTNSFGTTELVQVGSAYALYGSGGSVGPTLTYNGSAVTVGEFGSGVAPIGAAPTSNGGYEIAWLIPGSPNQYAIWVTNSSGVFQSSSAALTGTSSQLEQAELTFNQDLNNDGSIGPPPPPPPTVIRTDTNSFGTTKLTQVGNEYFLYGAGGTSGPAITYNGSAVTVGQFGSGVAPIGAALTASGYEVAWLIPGSPNQYAIWVTNSSGVFQSSSAALTGTSSQLEQAELTFNQDLNNDGSIGPPPPPPPTVIRTDTNSFGTTKLTQVGNEYFLYGASGTSGPAITYNGSAVTVGQFGSGVAPIGAAPTSNGGYEIAWLIPGSPNQWAIWNTNSSGVFQSSSAALTGTSSQLEQAELTFNQDLNNDGSIGPPPPPPPTVIRTDTNSFGTTELVQVGNEYFLYGASGTSGPAINYNGSAVTVGQFGSGVVPIGAAPTSNGGYEIAWLIPGSPNQWAIWNTDSSGNFQSSSAALTASSPTLQQAEVAMNQDLNQNGTIGTSQGSSQGSSSASATIAAGDTLEIASASSGSVTFQASTGTLQLDQPSTFTGWISGFTGDGSLSGSDQIDLRGIAFNSVQDGYTNNVLSVGDSSGDTARLDFIGTYSLANFKFASDNNGGTIVYDPPVQSPGATATLLADLSTIGSATPLAGFDTNAPIGGAANDISSLTSLAASQIHHS